MKKLILLLSIISLFCQSTLAQTGGLNFQGIARNATGAVLANQKINLKFSILKITETGAVEYTETKEATTNAQGIFAVVVGEVNATSFAAVDWKVTPKFLKVEMDPVGGTSFVAMGTTRLQNVPYAYYANGVNANNIDGTVPVSKGGTGATDAAAARTNLGLVIGTNVQAPLVAGTDYLTLTGNAATATLAGNITATSNTTLNAISNLNTVGTITTGIWSGTTIAIAKGGTGAATAGAALTNLGAESITNKSTDIILDANSLTKYPSVKTIKDYIDTRISSSVTTNTSTNLLAHYVGELFGGGIVVSVWKEAGVDHGLIASMIDLSNSISGGNIPGTNPTHSPADGQAYTNGIVATAGNTVSNCAANLCDSYINLDYGTGVYSDWYLPSFIELKAIYNNSLILHKVLDSSMAPKFQVPMSPFVGIYHSSTYYSSYRLSLSFYEGDIKSQSVPFLCSVRAVRRF